MLKRSACVMVALALLMGFAVGADQKPLVINPTTGKTEQLQSGNRLTLPDASGDLIALAPGVQTAARVLSLPVLTGDRTLAVLDQAQTFTNNQTISATTASTSTTTGALVVGGGVGVGGQISVPTLVNFYSSTTGKQINAFNGGDLELVTRTAGDAIRFYSGNGALALTLTSTQNATFAGSVTVGSTTLLTTSVALTNGAAAATGTLTNAPAAGNPTKWIPINDNGTTRYLPAW